MVKKILFLFILLMVACQKKEADPTQSKPFTANQEKIISWYNTSVKLRNRNHLQIIKYADSIQENNKKENNTFRALGYISSGIYYSAINNDSLCFKNYNEAYNLLKDSKNDSLLSIVHAGLGSYYKHTGDYPKSLKELIHALQLAEKLKDTVRMGGVYANLGQLYFQKDDIKESKRHLQISMELLDKHKNQPAYLIAIHSMANVYGMGGQYDKALELDEEGIRISEQINSNSLKATFLDNKANCFMFSNRLDSARYYFNECLKLDMLGKNDKQISDTYANLAYLAVFSNNEPEVMQNTQKSIAIAQGINYSLGVAKNYNLLIDFYKRKGDFKNAFEYSQKFQNVYKELINTKKETSVAEFRTFYETEKKENDLLISNAKVSEKENQIRRKNVQFQILILVSLALLVIAYLIFRQQRMKNKQQEQEFQLKSAIKEIETQNKLHEQRLSISRDLHDNIGAQLTFVISSVDNLKFGNQINDSKVENQLTKISNFTRETIIELRDTIWAMNKNEFTFEDLRSRIFNFIEKAKIAKEEVQFVFVIDDELKEIKMSSIIGINIYRTIQEAINNSIKYSEAKKIDVFVAKENKCTKISISDDGKGFDVENTEAGNGLQNMKKRITDVGGTFELISQPNHGTIIIILIE